MKTVAGKSDQQTYAAAVAREFLRGELADKPNDVLEPVAGLIDDDRALRLIMHYRSIWPEVKRRAGNQNLPDSFGETRLARLLVGNAGSRTLDRAFRAGNVSQLQGAVGLTKNSRDASDALTEIVSRLSNEGTIATLTGPPGAGKTATTLDVSRAWGAYTGGAIYGVTTWEGFDKVVRSDLEMLEEMASHKRPSLGVLDETMQELTGRGADNQKAETFADRASLIRKQEDDHGPHAKRGSLLLVSHNWSRMNKPTREMTTLVIQKPSRHDPGKVVLWESDGGEDNREKVGEFKGLTDTRERYPEHEASEFNIVLEDEQDDGADDGPTPEEAAKEAHIETVIRACQPWEDDDGMSYGEAAQLVPYGSSWAGERVREWCRGKHRTLVADPKEETA